MSSPSCLLRTTGAGWLRPCLSGAEIAAPRGPDGLRPLGCCACCLNRDPSKLFTGAVFIHCPEFLPWHGMSEKLIFPVPSSMHLNA